MPVLRVFADGKPHGRKDVQDQVAQALQLDAESLSLLLADGRTPVHVNRSSWAVSYLHRAGALRRLNRGVYEITDRGRSLLARGQDKLTIRDLLEFEEFRKFHNFRQGVERTAEPAGVSAVSPEEQLASAWKQLQESLAEQCCPN